MASIHDERASLTHFNASGRAKMVDISEKMMTSRVAVARAVLQMQEETVSLIRSGQAAKGDVLAVAQVAAIMAAKKTSEVIPMCHPVALTGVDIDFSFPDERTIMLTVMAKTVGSTGVEMEALTAASIGALTIYDMVKAIDRGMTINFLGLLEKDGGKSGHYVREG